MEPQPPNTSAESAPRSSPAAAANGHGDAPPPGEALKQVGLHLAELKEYAGLYVTAKLDSLKLTVRNAVLYLALGIVGAIAGLGLLITAAALLLTGLAGGVAKMFDPVQPWAGALIVGFVVLAGAFGGVFFVMKRMTGSSRKQTIQKYEDRKRDQRNRYGHDVQERAREQAQQQP